ncbi:MAG TPA: 50S ribosomal protein L30 [Gemmatimonadota bacterium]|jgi:large subunit ribosomal protein L30|nr:50S ribosomal protein L30 [Gemmatimonadota bacterium]
MVTKKLRITQSKSDIGQPRRMRDTLRALGLKGYQRSAEQPDNPAIRGMISKVRHLVTVEER